MWVKRRVRFLVLTAALLATAVAAYAFLVEPRRFVLREVTLPCAGLRSSPVRILLFSDVDFMGIGSHERAVREAAVAFDPDLVLVAGDLFERSSALRRGFLLESAAEHLASLPARHGRFLVPGEQESPVVRKLRAAWPESAVTVLVNERREIHVRGERLDLFGADPEASPAPWSIGAEGSRTFVRSRGRHMIQTLLYRGAGVSGWEEIEITLAFQALHDESLLDVRFAWEEGPTYPGGTGWRLVRNEDRPDFFLRHFSVGRHELEGRWESGFVPPRGVWCRARIRLTEDGERARVRVKLWREAEAEPEGWAIDASSARADRRRSGTVVLGGRAGGRRYADLRVVAPDGTVLLDEPFRDPERLRSEWSYASELADWIFGGPDKDCAGSGSAMPLGGAEDLLEGGRSEARLKAPREAGLPPGQGTGSSPAAARLLLTHNPDIVLDLLDLQGPAPSIVLAGHTHGGQVRIPGIGALYTDTVLGRKYDRGLFELEGVRFFITSGIGTTGIPARLFSPPEAVLLTLVPASASDFGSPSLARELSPP